MTRGEILEQCENEMQTGAKNFYKSDLLSNPYIVENVPGTEIVAEYILNHIASFQGIEKVSRERPYLTLGHEKRVKDYHEVHQVKKISDFRRQEEHIAIELFYQSIYENRSFDFGKIIDYQIPLKNERNGGSSGAGKIDLLSVCKDSVYILELKKPDSEESMLRCLMEGYTYLKTVDQQKLIKEVSTKIGRDPAEMRVKCAPLVFENSRSAKEWELRNEKFSQMAQLAKTLGVDMAFIEKTDLLSYEQ